MERPVRRQALIDDRLEAVVTAIEPPDLREQVSRTTLAGGKRVRPTVTILSCEFVGGDPADALDFAVGIELVHTASLVVDDIIDRSPIRRDAPSAWSAFGHGPAIVASDGLLGEAFDHFSTDPAAMQSVTAAMVELGEGEAMELVSIPSTEAEYMTLARRKTGALFRAAAELGAIAADGDDETVAAIGEYAERVGVAFQIRDDVLDAVADPELLGKPTGRDASLDRPSLLQVTDLSPSAANQRARDQVELAIDALERIEPVDTEAEAYLRELAEFVVEREQ
ncbi:geranylgeranyl pyrophosphate synthase [Halovivax ruber XH-70]|uniref:Geranylgeranyl pyrophosphate synthase n=1 Tax=Halovivax ruber (strain DSM 18193 / JCM 13892 / XH-70) TaxID=797302 RepID=L0IEA8_HALRX|nr:polyprenyl synthetase family protein [Halovivax ruber]AGB17173.1 geranylgeranyl pyrophosphate synthase [Halovivax ruber XH-70]